MKAAFATDDGLSVNNHFGYATGFDVYEISPERVFFEGRRDVIENEEGEAGRIDVRLNVIRDCAILYVNAIGGSAAARVTRARIHPVKVPEGERIDGILRQMQHVLSHNPPPWLKKILLQEGLIR